MSERWPCLAVWCLRDRRDILLSLIPFIVVFMFRDAALTAGLAFAIAWAGGLLILRIVFFDGWRKLVSVRARLHLPAPRTHSLPSTASRTLLRRAK